MLLTCHHHNCFVNEFNVSAPRVKTVTKNRKDFECSSYFMCTKMWLILSFPLRNDVICVRNMRCDLSQSLRTLSFFRIK